MMSKDAATHPKRSLYYYITIIFTQSQSKGVITISQKITMDLELRFIDNATSQAKSTSKAFDQIEKEAKEAGREIDNLAKKKAKPSVDADTSKLDRKLSKTDSLLKKLGFRKTKTVIDADDRATAKITKALNKVKGWAGKKFNAFLELKDSNALRTLNKMSDGLNSLTRKTFRIPVKILDYATRPLRGLQNMLFSIKGLVAAITAGFAAQQLVINPINVADAYSSAKISFSTLLGESQGQQMMDNLDQFAKATPFNTTNVIENAQKMLAMGWDAESIIKDMEIIGNAAAATGKLDTGLESIVRAMSQIKTKGRLSTEELNQLAEAGIAAKAMLAEGLGYGTGDAGIAAMTKDLEEGLIASDVAIQALLAGMQKYDGMMDSMANETVEGLKSQLLDTFNINIVRKWGQGLQDGAKRGLGTVVDLLDDAEGAMEKIGDSVYEVGAELSNWAADKLENAVKRITEITDSYEFQNADLVEKLKMLWKGVITDPLREWWENGGRDKTIETAGEIGEWMGKTITSGLLAIFGVTDILDESNFPVDDEGNRIGMNVAQSFVDGFRANFDGAAITDAFVDAISDVWNALPTWAKIVLGVYTGGKVAGAVANFAGGVGSFVGGVKNVIGSAGTIGAGNAVVGATGLLGLLGKTGVAGVGASGILGGLANTGYTLVGGTSALTMGGGTAALIGGAGIAGGLAGGASLISGGVDMYRGFTTDDEIEREANLQSGGYKIGGVATGAALGAAIGSVVPVLGTALGALIGAGIGGIGGWILGENEADKIRATDDAINDVTAAVQDLETEEEKLEARNKLVWQNMQDHFGDIKLSMSEITRLANQIVWGEDLAKYETFATAMNTAAANLQSLNAAGQQIDRWLWKAGLGVTFNDDEIESIVASFDEYINSAKSYLENKHYEFTAAVGLLVDVESEGGRSIIESGNAFYAKYKEDLDAAGQELGELLTQSVADGFINADEQAAIIAAQEKMAAITEKIASAETKAELQLIDIKFGQGKLDIDSFDSFMTQIQATLDERMTANDEAFKVAVSALQLQLQEGAISEEEYNSQLQTLVDGYTAKVDSVKAEILNVELDIIGEAYAVDGVTKDKLSKALQDSLAQGIDPITWTTEQARQFLGIDSLSESSAGAIAQMLGGVASQLQLVEVDGQLLLNLGVTVPGDTPTKVEQAVDAAVPCTVDDDVDVIIKPLEKINKLNLTGADMVAQKTFSYSPLVNITAKLGTISPVSVPKQSVIAINQYRGGIVGPGSIPGYYDGGMVRGGAQLIKVAEEGSPEMIIPLSSQRRQRGLDLWEKAGQMLKVPGFARGGRTDGGDEGIRFMSYGSGEASGARTVHVDVGGVKVELHVNAEGSANIAEAVKAQLGEITDAVVGAIADELGAIFENTPVRGGVA